MKNHRKRGAALLGLALMLTPGGVAAAHPSTVHTVRPGGSIQAALDLARPGDTVLVRPGTYRENLEMSTDRVTLLGYGATLAAPDVPTHRRCSLAVESELNRFGVCVAGDLETVPGKAPIVRGFVHGVTIRGLTIARFPTTGIVGFGAVGTRIEHADIAGGASYGVLLALDSSDSVVASNRVHGGTSAAIYIGDSPNARSKVIGNEVYDNGVYGIFIRNASHGTIAGNDVRGNCVGVGFLPTRPDPTTVTDWRVTANRIHDNTHICPIGTPPLTAAGIYISGASNITVTHNLITGNAPADGTPTRGGGVVLLASEFGGPADPADNRVEDNVLHGNLPFDLAIRDEGVRNRVSNNICETSTPDGLCTHHAGR